MRQYTLLALLLPGLAAAQEKKDAKLDPLPEIKLDRKDPVAYEKDIEPIFANNCYSCHGPKKQESSLRLDSKADALKGGDS